MADFVSSRKAPSHCSSFLATKRRLNDGSAPGKIAGYANQLSIPFPSGNLLPTKTKLSSSGINMKTLGSKQEWFSIENGSKK